MLAGCRSKANADDITQHGLVVKANHNVPMTTVSRGPMVTTPVLQTGNDGSIPSGTTDQASFITGCVRTRPQEDRSGASVQKPADQTSANVLVEQRSARLPVTQEVVGSNPIGDARLCWKQRQHADSSE